MEYITLDMELADRIFPCLCSISLIKWNNSTVISSFSTLINPELEIEPFMSNHHNITESDIKSSPTLREVWPYIMNFIEGNVVFTHKGNSDIKYLKTCIDLDKNVFPDFQFGSVESIFKRTFPDAESKTLHKMLEYLKLDSKCNNSLLDARSLGLIINSACKETQTSNINELFDKIGYAGGFVVDNTINLYKAKKLTKNKRTDNLVYLMYV